LPPTTRKLVAGPCKGAADGTAEIGGAEPDHPPARRLRPGDPGVVADDLRPVDVVDALVLDQQALLREREVRPAEEDPGGPDLELRDGRQPRDDQRHPDP
jgi:hypothetical protein